MECNLSITEFAFFPPMHPIIMISILTQSCSDVFVLGADMTAERGGQNEDCADPYSQY